MSKHKKNPIIVKRRVVVAQPHHGGSWKIAYADFMTAMMAFFMVMWLLSISTPKQLVGIAEYFRMPLKVAINGGDKSSLSSSVLPGGGPDVMSRIQAELEQSENDAEDAARLREVKEQLDKMIESNPILKQLRAQLLIDITSEGLRIQIVDTNNRPMFELSSAKVEPYMRVILREIAPVLSELPNKLTLSGHTDATPFVQGEKNYSNWELSTDRANASRREMVIGGLAEQKVLRVMGLATTMNLNKQDPLDPVNRRISIIVLNRRAQTRIENENAGNAVVTDSRAAASGQINGITPPAVPASGVAPPSGQRTISPEH